MEQRRSQPNHDDNSQGQTEHPELKRKEYEKALRELQAELCSLQEWVKATGQRMIVVWEGRDAAGKGGTIKAITERVSPRTFRLVALPAPSDREKSQMYVQRYLAHFPAAGEIVIFDRSWYNRAGVNGVAISIIFGQADKILGVPVLEGGILPRLAEIVGKLGQIHGATLAVAIGTFAVMAIVSRLVPWLPPPLVGMVLAASAVPALGLNTLGVKTIGPVPAGIPSFTLPQVDPASLPPILAAAAGLALVSFSSLMLRRAALP